jgi:hypothetical protein
VSGKVAARARLSQPTEATPSARAAGFPAFTAAALLCGGARKALLSVRCKARGKECFRFIAHICSGELPRAPPLEAPKGAGRGEAQITIHSSSPRAASRRVARPPKRRR